MLSSSWSSPSWRSPSGFYFLAPPEWKARLGIGTGATSQLALVTTHMDRQQLASGNQLLTVTGRVINPTDERAGGPASARADPNSRRAGGLQLDHRSSGENPGAGRERELQQRGSECAGGRRRADHHAG